VDDLFTTILQVDAGGPPPVAVKYLFDFFDAAARRHGITDSEVVHTWKSNRSAAV
jgi:Plexin cytoplasmic RasGAP domain